MSANPDIFKLMLLSHMKWAPIVSGKAAKQHIAEGRGPIRGIASTERRDKDGHVVSQSGINWVPFLKGGTFTMKHPAGVVNSVGEPSRIYQSVLNGIKCSIVEGFLWLTDEIGLKAWEKACAMQSCGSSRRIGLSIEGYPLKFNKDTQTIERSIVHSIALDMYPKGELDTRMEAIMKAATGLEIPTNLLAKASVGYPAQGQPSTGAVAPLVPQSLQDANQPRGRLLLDTSTFDLLVCRTLKKHPGMTWGQGRDWVKSYLDANGVTP